MKTFGCCHYLCFLFSITSTSLTGFGIRNLVTKHAFASYFINEVVNDVVDKPIILHNLLDLSHPKVQFGFEFTTFSIVSYMVYKYYFTSISTFYYKFNKIPEYKKYYRRFKFCIFVLTIVYAI